MTQQHLNILLIEDNKLCAYTLRRVVEYISDVPVKFIHSTTMEEAIFFLQKRAASIDIIILDLGLPDTCSCEESFMRVKNAVTDIPIVILTNNNDPQLNKALIMEGAQDYVSKDVLRLDPELLINAIDHALNRHRAQQRRLVEKDQVISWMSGSYSVEGEYSRRSSNS